MKKREHESQTQNQTQQSQQGKDKDKDIHSNMNTTAEGKRLGVWGMTELDDDKKRWIYEDDKETLRVMKEKEGRGREKSDRMGLNEFGKISRYDMVKRIW